MQDLSGQLLKGYELLDRIGAGGFGAVYRARQTTVEREVAVKFILPAYANDLDFIRRFESEANLVARLEHPHIAPLYDFWRDPGGAYLVMRFLRGGSVHQSLQDGPYELNAASQLLDQIASALDFAHRQNVIHRDIKPSNILLDEDGNAYLADFGIAQDLARINKNKAVLETIAGSLDYMAPEQAHGEAITPRSDIYSLGITLYEMLAGDHPFKNGSSIERFYKHINDPVPEINTLPGDTQDSVNEIIQKATAKNPKRRYQDALDMAAAFRALAGSGDSADAGLVESLTRREQEILQLIVEGDTNQEIAQKLYLEISTVKWHISRMYKKLGVRSRVQAIVRARDLNLIVVGGELEAQSQQEGSISVVLPQPLNPYKGLQAFEPADSRDFFGREALVEELLARLSQNGSTRFLAVVGPSGSGKSSLIKAGLIPAFWQGKLAGSEKWFIVNMQPGARPLDDLEIALTRIAADQAPNLRRHLDRDAHGLLRAAGLILPNDESELLLVIDQFEEIFTLVEEEAARDHFMNLIRGAVSDPRSRVRVIIALRADYYDRPLQYPAFGELVRGHLETLLPLSAEELERAIVYPAQGVGVSFEPGLVATIIEDVNYRPGTLPLLQFALAELFEQREKRTLTREAYQALGGAAGALARRAEALYQEQDAVGREAIRQIFLRLVSVVEQQAGTASDIVSVANTRRRVLRSELLSVAADPDQLDEIIDTFAAYRLLSLDHDPATRAATVEVAHEAILREWERLRGWLEESLVDLGLHRQLQRAARDWVASGGEPSFLLRGARLDSLQTWAGESSLVLSRIERQFLETSIEQREQRAAAERERQEQESRLEGRAKFRLRALLVISALALLVVTGLIVTTLFFSQQQRQAETFAQLTLARDLVTKSQANLQVDPELSALLALQAAEQYQGVDEDLPPELENLLHQVAQAEAVLYTFHTSGPIAFALDGSVMAVGNEESILRAWNPLTGQDKWGLVRYQGRNQEIGDLAFSPDGDLLATASPDGYLKVWIAATGEEIGFIDRPEGFTGVAFNPVSEEMLTIGSDESVHLWDLTQLAGTNKSEPVEIIDPVLFAQTTSPATTVVYSPDGQNVAMFVPGTGIIIVDAASGEQRLEIPVVGALTDSLAFSPDGHYIAGRSGDLDVTLWDAVTAEELLTVSDSSSITNVAFSPDGRYITTANNNGQVTLWDMGSGAAAVSLSGHAGRILGMAFHPNGRLLATSAADGLTRIWDLDQAGSELFTIAAHDGRAYSVEYNADSSLFASAGDDGWVKLWDAETGTLLHALPGPKDRQHFLAISPDGQKLVAANRDGGLTVWEIGSGLELLSLQSDEQLTVASVNDEGTRIAAGSQQGSIHLWDALTGEQIFVIDSGEDRITSLLFLSPQVINAWDETGMVTAWDAASGSNLGEVYCPTTSQIDADLSLDGRFMAVACNEVFLVDRQDLPQERTILFILARSDIGQPTGVAFNPDGTLLAIVDSVGVTSLWDTETGQVHRRISGPQTFLERGMRQGGRGGFGTTYIDTTGWRPLSGVDISPDGRYLATAGSDGTINVYILSLAELMEAIRSHLSRDLSDIECQTYLNLPACPTDQDIQ